MKASNAIKPLVYTINEIINILLTTHSINIHTSLNTPAKPMLFSNNMLKLSGLFYAYHFLKTAPSHHNDLSGGVV